MKKSDLILAYSIVALILVGVLVGLASCQDMFAPEMFRLKPEESAGVPVPSLEIHWGGDETPRNGLELVWDLEALPSSKTVSAKISNAPADFDRLLWTFDEPNEEGNGDADDIANFEEPFTAGAARDNDSTIDISAGDFVGTARVNVQNCDVDGNPGTLSAYFIVKVVKESSELPPTVTPIPPVSVLGLIAPVTGDTPVGILDLSPGADSYTIAEFSWTGDMAAGKFAGATIYTANITLKANANFQFSSGIIPTTSPGTGTVGNVTVSDEASENTLSFTVVFAKTVADGTIDVSIGFLNYDVTITPNPIPPISKAADGQLELDASGGGFTGVKWYIDENPVEAGTGDTLSFSVSGLAVKDHKVTFMGTKDSIPYSKVISFTVTN